MIRKKVGAAAACLVLVLAGCGEEQSSGEPASTSRPVSAVIGRTGGTLAEPSGAKVVLPPGAVAADTTIAIEQTSVGAPALPDGFVSTGPTFALTPHGVTFAVPVTVTIPFDPAAVPDGATPTLFKTNAAQNAFEPVPGATVNGTSMSAEATTFSGWKVGAEPPFGDPTPANTDPLEKFGVNRKWTFRPIDLPETSGDWDGFRKLEKKRDFQSNPTFEIDNDNDQSLAVFSSADGVTFWAKSEGAGSALLHQSRSFIKRASNATLQLVMTAGLLEALDHNNTPLPSECRGGLETCVLLAASISFDVQALTLTGNLLRDRNGVPVLDAEGLLSLQGWTGDWRYSAGELTDKTTLIWTESNFEFTRDVEGDLGQFHPRARLIRPIVMNLDISDVEIGDKFRVTVDINASAHNYRHRESGIGAFLRDPAKTGGTVMNTTGLEPTDEPFAAPVARGPEPCTGGPDPAAGVLSFSAASYSVSEAPFAGVNSRSIFVTRTGGSEGPVSVAITSGGGTATPGVHYAPLNTSVRFADGDTTPRRVDVDILPNTAAEADTTVDLTLSQPGGCATLGAPSRTVLTVVDDDGHAVGPERFTVGGTVKGLIGTGLVLDNNDGLFLEIFGNGPFTFVDLPLPSGSPYKVGIFNRPHDPGQNCTVVNGEGTFTDHNVTDVEVNCV